GGGGVGGGGAVGKGGAEGVGVAGRKPPRRWWLRPQRPNTPTTVGHCGLTAKRSRSWSNEATISSPVAISPPRACSFAAPPKREAPKVPSRLERRLIPSHLSALARLARLPISPKHANGISAPPSSAQVPPRSNWRVSRTFVEVKTAWATGLCALPRSNAAVLGRLVAPKNDFPASNSQISM